MFRVRPFLSGKAGERLPWMLWFAGEGADQVTRLPVPATASSGAPNLPGKLASRTQIQQNHFKILLAGADTQ